MSLFSGDVLGIHVLIETKTTDETASKKAKGKIYAFNVLGS